MSIVRRFTTQPSIERLLEIEAINIVDLPPQAPTTGVGSGALLCVGEFEDGPFAALGDAPEFSAAQRNQGVQETFGSEDYANRFGGFGFTYGTVPSNNPAARRRLFEFWNGNGFLKLKYCRPLRLMIARVDTSVGEVAISPLASILGAAGPYALTVGQQIAITTDTGGPASSTAIAAVVATVAGVLFVSSGFVGGESITVSVDGGPAVTITFAAADQSPAQVAARINLVLGYTAAVAGVGVTLSGIRKGTGGSLTLANGSAGALASIGLVAGTTAGTGNVSNLAAVTTTEIATIVNATVALTAINVSAAVDSTGRIRLLRSGAPGTLLVAASAMATALGITTIGTVVVAGQHVAGTIPAGTRVRTAGGAEWVTMQTLTIAAGTAAAPNLGPHVVKVRPALDDGTGLAAIAGAVSVLVDQPTFSQCAVNNPNALNAALTENQMDVVYGRAFDATLDPTKPAREASYSISARRSDSVVRVGRQNALDASAAGFLGRKFITGAPLGFTTSQAIADVALWRSDRLFYCYPGVKTQIPEIAFRGAAGGLGFTDDGVITVRADNPLATINCQLNPEENPGQATGLIESFLAVEDQASPLAIDAYIAFKANGICAPRRDTTDGMLFQSGITSDITDGKRTQARRKMADFIQDSLARALGPYSKKLATQARRDGSRGVIDGFLSGLASQTNPELQRIDSYLVDERSGQSPDLTARGIAVFIVKARTLSSLDAIVLQTEIGEGVITITDLS